MFIQKSFSVTELNFKWITKRFGSSITSKSSIGFIGLGVMGSHMARNISKQFKNVSVYDLKESAALSLKGEGVTVAKHVNDLSEADCIISMIATNEQVMQLYQSPNGLISKMKPGTLLIDCSTVDPGVPQQLAAEAHLNNITFVDAPVSGGVVAAESGQLTFMVGGSEEGATRCEPVLRCMGKNVIYCGKSGSGQVAKICNNLLLGISMIATAESMNLGIRLGLDPKLLASVINSSTGRCWSSDTYNPVPGVLEGIPASNNYQGGFLTRLMVKDLTIAKSVANKANVTTTLGEQALAIYKLACEQGKADLDFSAVYAVFKEMSYK